MPGGGASEPRRGRRNWQGKAEARDAVHANRRRIRGTRGKRLLRQRGELPERSFAHALDSGGMRRTHLRGHANILKRLLIHVGGFNLGLLMRKLVGVGKPRCLQGAMRVLRCGFGDTGEVLLTVCRRLATLLSMVAAGTASKPRIHAA